jgi:hypothetical protein
VFLLAGRELVEWSIDADAPGRSWVLEHDVRTFAVDVEDGDRLVLALAPRGRDDDGTELRAFRASTGAVGPPFASVGGWVVGLALSGGVVHWIERSAEPELRVEARRLDADGATLSIASLRSLRVRAASLDRSGTLAALVGDERSLVFVRPDASEPSFTVALQGLLFDARPDGALRLETTVDVPVTLEPRVAGSRALVYLAAPDRIVLASVHERGDPLGRTRVQLPFERGGAFVDAVPASSARQIAFLRWQGRGEDAHARVDLRDLVRDTHEFFVFERTSAPAALAWSPAGRTLAAPTAGGTLLLIEAG